VLVPLIEQQQARPAVDRQQRTRGTDDHRRALGIPPPLCGPGPRPPGPPRRRRPVPVPRSAVRCCG